MVPSTCNTASTTQIMHISLLNSSGHTHRCRHFIGTLTDHNARLAEICVLVKLHTAGLAPATLMPVSLAFVTFCQLAWRSQELFPKARLIHDRFHLIQYLNKGIDPVRRREVKQHEELKPSRYAILKNEPYRTQTQDEIFNVIQEANLQVSVAWRLREEFKAIFRCDSWSDAKQNLTLTVSIFPGTKPLFPCFLGGFFLAFLCSVQSCFLIVFFVSL